MNVTKILRSSSIILLMFSVTAMWGETLYVFYPSTLQSSVVQNSVQGANPDVTVMVFSKYRDFITKASTDQPDVVFVKDGGLSDFSGYTVKHNAYRNGSKSEKYVLLSIDKPVTPSSVTAETVIGVVDFKRRNQMNAFVKSVLGVSPTVKHVTKVEDVLPLFNFGLAEVALVTESDVAYFKKTSNLNFIVTPVTSKNGIAVIAEKANSVTAIKAALEISKLVPNYIRSIEWRN